MFASAPHFLPASNSAAAFATISAAASVCTCARAIGNCTPWFWPIGRPNTSRSVAYADALPMNQRASPTHSAAIRIRSAFMLSRM